MNATFMIGAMVVLALAIPGLTAFAQDKTEKQDPAKTEAKEAKTQVPAEPLITATLTHGVHFKSSDGNFDATLGDSLGIHYRVVVIPFATSEDGCVHRNRRLGVAGTAGTVQKSSTNAFDSTSPDLAILYPDATAGTLAGPRKRLGGEASWNAGPFGLRGEVWR